MSRIDRWGKCGARWSYRHSVLGNRQPLGFTLVELLVVITIIGILIALLLPAVQSAREAARNAQCMNNLKQVGLALQMHSQQKGELPWGRVENRETWALMILPYLEQENLHSLWDFDKEYYHQSDEFLTSVVPTYFCPTRRRAGSAPAQSISGDHNEDKTDDDHVPGPLADYACSSGSTHERNGKIAHADYSLPRHVEDNPNFPSDHVRTTGLFIYGVTNRKLGTPLTFTDCRDGLSNTVLVGEKHIPEGKFGIVSYDGSTYNGDHGSARRPAGISAPLAKGPRDTGYRFGSYHPGVCNFVLGDGSVRSIAVSIDATTLNRLADRSDGQPIGQF